jgi:hypothetical protein
MIRRTFGSNRPTSLHRVGQHPRQIKWPDPDRAIFDLREVDQVVHGGQQPATAGVDVAERPKLLRPGIPLQQISISKNGRQRGAKLVAEVIEQALADSISRLGTCSLLLQFVAHVSVMVQQVGRGEDSCQRQAPIEQAGHEVRTDRGGKEADHHQRRCQTGQPPGGARIAMEYRRGKQGNVEHPERQRPVVVEIGNEGTGADGVDGYLNPSAPSPRRRVAEVLQRLPLRSMAGRPRRCGNIRMLIFMPVQG